MKRITIYGKGGISKSTAVSNVSVAIAAMGLTVVQISCDPKADSTRNLIGEKNILIVLSTLQEEDDAVLEDIAVRSLSGVPCTESGSLVPNVDCAGRGTITTFERLEELGTHEVYRSDVVFYDVPGDVVCGGFAMPIQGDYIDEVCTVTSGEMMSLYATSSTVHAVKSFGKRRYATLRGLILNARSVEGGDELVDKAAGEIEVPASYRLPRHPLIQRVEAQGKTVAKAFPNSGMVAYYRELAQLLIQEAARGGCSCPM